MSGFIKRQKAVDTVNPAGGIDPAMSPNVGQYGWTSYDANHVNQIIQYVDMCKEFAERAKDSADYIAGRFGELQDFMRYIEGVYNELQPLVDQLLPIYEDIKFRHADIITRHEDVKNIQTLIVKDKNEISQIVVDGTTTLNNTRDAAIVNINTARVEAVAEVSAIKNEATVEANRAKTEADRATTQANNSAASATSSSASATASASSASDSESSNTGSKGWYDKSYELYLDLKEGQVYRGTWNPKSAMYPLHEGTNSIWDVILDAGVDSVAYDGKTWRSGDRLVYVLVNNKYDQISSGSGVTSVNGKTGSVSLTYSDVGAVDANLVSAIGEFGKIPRIGGNGVMEIGRYIDWHYESAKNDYDIRLEVSKNSDGVSHTLVVGGGNFNASHQLYEKGQRVYSPNNKPTSTDLGFLPSNGSGKMTGALVIETSAPVLRLNETGVTEKPYFLVVDGGNMRMNVNTTGVGDSDVVWRWNDTLKEFYTPGKVFSKDGIFDGSSRVYSAINKPTPADLGAATSANARLTGSAVISAVSNHLILQDTDQSNKEWVVESNGGEMRLVERGVATRLALKPGGGASFSGEISNSGGEIKSRSSNSYRMSDGSIGTFWRKDGSNLYLMRTPDGEAADGTWSSHRPFAVELATGNVNMRHDVRVGGTLTPEGRVQLGTGGSIHHNALDAANTQLLAGGSGRAILGNRETVTSVELQSSTGNLSISQGSTNYRVYHEGYKPNLSDILGSAFTTSKKVTLAKPSSATAGKYYPVLVTAKNEYPEITIRTASAAASYSVNNNTFTGKVVSQGGTDIKSFVNGEFTMYDTNERGIYSIVGQSGTGGHSYVVYLEAAAFPAEFIVHSNVDVSCSGSAVVIGETTFNAGISGMTTDSSYGTKCTVLQEFNKGRGFYGTTGLFKELKSEGKVITGDQVQVVDLNNAGAFLARRPGQTNYAKLGQGGNGLAYIGVGPASNAHTAYVLIGPNNLKFSSDGSAETRIYHEGFKPSLSELGGVALTGGTMTGPLFVPRGDGVRTIAGSSDDYYTSISAESGYSLLWRRSTNSTKASQFIGINNSRQAMFRQDNGTGDGTYSNRLLYHTGYKPTAAELGFLPADGTGKMSGRLDLAGNTIVNATTMNSSSGNNMIRAGGTGNVDLVVGSTAGRLIFDKAAGTELEVREGSTTGTVYTTLRKPTPGELGVLPYQTWKTNLNDLTTSGMYQLGAGISNHPAGNGNGDHLIHQNWDANAAYQIYTNYGSGSMYIRNKNGGTWQGWRRVYDSLNRPSSTDIGLGNVPNTVHDVSPTGSTVVVRDSAGDVKTRLVRSNYQFESSCSGGMAFRNSTTDDYIRFCNQPVSITNWLGAVRTSDVAGTSGWSNVIGKIPRINSSGVMDIGKYIDFANTGFEGDYSCRLYVSDAGNLISSGGFASRSYMLESAPVPRSATSIKNPLEKLAGIKTATHKSMAATLDVSSVAKSFPEGASDGAVSMEGLIALLVETCKELKSEVAELKAEVNKLKEK